MEHFVGRALGVALFMGLAASVIAVPLASSTSIARAPIPVASGPTVVTPGRTTKSQAPESLAVLYDQYNSWGSGWTSSQNFGDGFHQYDDWAADDFVVPPGWTWWVVDGIDVQGTYDGSGPASSVNVYFYTNGSGDLPGTLYASQLNRSVGIGPSFQIAIDPVILVPGTYWVLVQANQDFNQFGQWGWTDRTVRSNAGAAWLNPDGGFGGLCRSWGRRETDCNIDPGAPDQVYRLRGTVACYGSLATIVGTSGNDTMTGTSGPDVIAGLDGHDTINGGGGADVICGGPGDDRINGGDENYPDGDRLFGETGNDVIDAGQGYIDLVDGGPGNDQLTGNPFSVVSYLTAENGVTLDLARRTASGGGGNDTVTGFSFAFGSDYNDTLIGDQSGNIFFSNGGHDTVRGAEGFDILGFASDSQVRANLATGQTFGGESEGNDNLADIEGLYSGEGNDELIGSRQDNFLSGNGGHNVIRGGGGADSIFAEGGNDQLYGEAGNDTLEGGAGTNRLDGGPGQNDQVSYAWIPDGVGGQTGVNGNLAARTATATGSAATISDTLVDVESFAGSSYADTLSGNSTANALIGNEGRDILRGRSGNDFLAGGADVDTADGAKGQDYCLDAEVNRRCEIVATTRRRFASAGLDRNAAVPATESFTQPTCSPAGRGGGVTTIAPPKRIIDPGGNDRVRWQAWLYRQGGRMMAKTPLVEGRLASPANPDNEHPAAWTRTDGSPINWPIAKRLGSGIYYWEQKVTLLRLGGQGRWRIMAYFQPPGAASAVRSCDFRAR